MQWTDDALVLGCRPFGEAAVIVEVMTRDHGRHLGIVHGGRSRRLRPVLQAGNSVVATWRARLDEQLGSFTLEADALRAGELIASPVALAAVSVLAQHLRLLPERDPHPDLHGAATFLLQRLTMPDVAPGLFVRFEVMLLAELGYGLDLTACAATGALSDLAYVSPKSGRAVSRGAGEPYRARLLPLPDFLQAGRPDVVPSSDEVRAGFDLTGFFLDAYVYRPPGRAASPERARLVALACPEDRSGMVPD